MRYLDWYCQRISFIGNVLFKDNLLDPSFMMHGNFRENTSVLFILASDVDCHKPVVSIFSHSSNNFSLKNDVHFSFLSLGKIFWMSLDNSNTFSLIFQWNDLISQFSFLCPKHSLIMVHNRLLQKTSPSSTYIHLRWVLNIRMKNKLW